MCKIYASFIFRNSCRFPARCESASHASFYLPAICIRSMMRHPISALPIFFFFKYREYLSQQIQRERDKCCFPRRDNVKKITSFSLKILLLKMWQTNRQTKLISVIEKLHWQILHDLTESLILVTLSGHVSVGE